MTVEINANQINEAFTREEESKTNYEKALEKLDKASDGAGAKILDGIKATKDQMNSYNNNNTGAIIAAGEMGIKGAEKVVDFARADYLRAKQERVQLENDFALQKEKETKEKARLDVLKVLNETTTTHRFTQARLELRTQATILDQSTYRELDQEITAQLNNAVNEATNRILAGLSDPKNNVENSIIKEVALVSDPLFENALRARLTRETTQSVENDKRIGWHVIKTEIVDGLANNTKPINIILGNNLINISNLGDISTKILNDPQYANYLPENPGGLLAEINTLTKSRLSDHIYSDMYKPSGRFETKSKTIGLLETMRSTNVIPAETFSELSNLVDRLHTQIVDNYLKLAKGITKANWNSFATNIDARKDALDKIQDNAKTSPQVESKVNQISALIESNDPQIMNSLGGGGATYVYITRITTIINDDHKLDFAEKAEAIKKATALVQAVEITRNVKNELDSGSQITALRGEIEKLHKSGKISEATMKKLLERLQAAGNNINGQKIDRWMIQLKRLRNYGLLIAGGTALVAGLVISPVLLFAGTVISSGSIIGELKNFRKSNKEMREKLAKLDQKDGDSKANVNAIVVEVVRLHNPGVSTEQINKYISAAGINSDDLANKITNLQLTTSKI